MYNTTVIAKIILKKINNTISLDEMLLLDEWAKQSLSNADLLEKMMDEELVLDDILIWLELKRGEEEITWGERLEIQTLSKIESVRNLSSLPKKRRYTSLLLYAAAILLLCFVTLVYHQNKAIKGENKIVTDLSPGKNRAFVTLVDGRVIELSGDKNGIVSGDKLIYADGTLISDLGQEAVLYSELKTPRGGYYQITLSDGTRVWLNSDSKLTYPSRFEGDVREVELEGEAYFEVVSAIDGNKKKPFIVKTAQQKVEVLGTVFNIMAYTDDDDVETTLIEGGVKIQAAGKMLLLNPGEQGVTDGSNLNKRKVDVGPYLAWKNNEFFFEETELRKAMKMLGRWYDFDVVYEEPIPSTHFYGTIDRNKGLSEVLKIMQNCGLKFRIEKIDGKNKLYVLK